MNQLEEVIDQKNEKIELLRGQLDSVTASHEGGDIGALRKQLLKMEQSMQVRWRDSCNITHTHTHTMGGTF